jgi:hypothetical protein
MSEVQRVAQAILDKRREVPAGESTLVAVSGTRCGGRCAFSAG